MRETAIETLGERYDPIQFHKFILDMDGASFRVMEPYFKTWAAHLRSAVKRQTDRKNPGNFLCFSKTSENSPDSFSYHLFACVSTPALFFQSVLNWSPLSNLRSLLPGTFFR